VTLRDVVQAYGIFVIAYFAVLNLNYIVLVVTAWRSLGSYLRTREFAGIDEAFASPLTPAISVILPAYNEAPVIVESVRSLLALRYARFEIIVVNDGSKDATIDTLVDAFDLVPVAMALRTSTPHAEVRQAYLAPRHPELIVLDKVNGGKADALNAGVSAAQHPYVCAIDADAVLEPEALLRVAMPLLDDPDLVVAAGGIVRIANGCQVDTGQVTKVGLPRNRLATLQVVEYFRAFLVGRVGWSRMRSLLIISGAFGLFRRSAVEAVGGWWTGTVGEDMELVVRLHRYFQERGERYRVMFVPDPVCWTEVPESFRSLASQRRRWQRGLVEALWRHRLVAFRPRYGRLGLVATPYFILFEMVGPVLTLASYALLPLSYALGLVSTTFMIAFFVVALLVGQLLSVAALALEEFSFRRQPRWREVSRLIWYAFVENFGYRQLTDFWRVQGVWDALRRTSGWGEMTRQGFATVTPGGAEAVGGEVDDDAAPGR
jgi:cellulose synthase/poly-beta-1,6-N-acetylglucosamine synthase-like glycosyltransferase